MDQELFRQLISPLRQDQSKLLIPRFYFKSKPSTAANSSNGNPLQQLLDRAGRDLATERWGKQILTNDDLDGVWKLLQEAANESALSSSKDSQTTRENDNVNNSTGTNATMITYADYQTVAAKLSVKFHAYFRASIFLRMQHDDNGKVDINQVFSYILRKASLVQERLCISAYDGDWDGYLSEQEVEKYLADLIPGFPQLQSIENDFTSFYLCGAVRKFFFFLDPQRKGRIAISFILTSPILSEFFELQQPDLAPNLLLSNWFSMYSAMKVYNQYVDLDLDRNGMLSVGELLKFSKSRYSELFIRRVFEECQTYGGEMDYRNYLDFVLAMNEINSNQSLHYLFRILDIDAKGYLDEFTIGYYLRSMAPHVPMQINIPILTYEIMDMANVETPGKLTLNDLIKSGIGGNVVSILIDIHSLIQNQTKD